MLLPSLVYIQHVLSGKFLTAVRSAAVNQKDAVRLVLSAKGSALSYFKLMPRFNYRSEGGPIFYEDSVRLAL